MEMKMVTKMCVAAANYIIRKTNEFNETQEYTNRISMTCKRLQKLLYFSDIEFMRKHSGTSMFRDEFYAWPSGPVIPSVYYKFMKYQNGYMNPLGGEHEDLTTDMENAIDSILAQTNKMDTLDLVEVAHDKSGPWAQVYNPSDPDHKQIISKTDIYNYYVDRNIFGAL